MFEGGGGGNPCAWGVWGGVSCMHLLTGPEGEVKCYLNFHTTHTPQNLETMAGNTIKKFVCVLGMHV